MKKRQKQSAMFARVEEWEKSGKTKREFAKEISISKSCLEYWIRKKRDIPGSSSQFVELIPAGKLPGGIQQILSPDQNTTQAQIVFTFPSGMCVKVYG